MKSICVLFFLFSVSIYTQGIVLDAKHDTTLFNDNGIYTIVASAEKPTILPGDTVKINIYLKGIGEIYNHSFSGIVPEYLIDGNFVISHVQRNKDKNIFTSKDDIQPYTSNFTVRFPSWYFLRVKQNPFYSPFYGESNLVVNKISRPPLYIKFKISENVEPGEYLIPLFFLYNNRYYQMSETTVKINVISHAQANSNWLIASLAIWGSIISIALQFSKKIKKYAILVIGISLILSVTVVFLLM